MSLGLLDQCLSEFDRETGVTRRVLARVPDDRLSWGPHPRSMTLGRLATHVASLPGWLPQILNEATLDLASVPATAVVDDTAAAILARFDAGVADARRALCESTDARLADTWTLRKDGEVVLTLPRIVALRTEGLYHLTHHRGQLTVYLRLLDIPIPPIYGPTADEGRL
ncbi:MAG: DinB family protein [Vicinamibacteria bacterium]|nr:DinB family protein [Vicinamibacteria bacterium]